MRQLRIALQLRQASPGGLWAAITSGTGLGTIAAPAYRGGDRALFRLGELFAYFGETDQLEDVHVHDLRHSAASMMVSAGHSLELIGGVLGHSQASTTQRYAHLMDGALRRAVNGLGRAIAPNGAAI